MAESEQRTWCQPLQVVLAQRKRLIRAVSISYRLVSFRCLLVFSSVSIVYLLTTTLAPRRIQQIIHDTDHRPLPDESHLQYFETINEFRFGTVRGRLRRPEAETWSLLK